MTRILVSGYYGFGNAGDEAVLAGMIAAIRAVDPAAQFTVVSGRAALTRQLHGVEAISRGRFREIWAAAAASDLVLSGGGSLLQDVTGFKSVPYYLGVAGMGLVRGRPVMFYGQGIGPLQSPVSRWLVRLVAGQVHAISVRDEESLVLLKALGIQRPRVYLSADAAFVLPPGTAAAGRNLLAAAGFPEGAGPAIAVALRPLARLDAAGETDFVRSVARALDQVVRETGARLCFVPMQPVRDIPLARRVREHMAYPATVLDGDYDYRQVMHIIAACELVVGMRYHSLVFAAMAGRPMAGLSYDPKNDHLLRSLGLAVPVPVEHLDPAALVRSVWTGLASSSDAARMAGQVAVLADRARLSAHVAMDLVAARRASRAGGRDERG